MCFLRLWCGSKGKMSILKWRVIVICSSDDVSWTVLLSFEKTGAKWNSVVPKVKKERCSKT
jgi:hypothetical protein